ncbi:hypothetical protein B0A69_19760 [Chryseobacterium shigense]|uniref:Lipoprotein n=2 Tax=Chryseobacterium shigense TaxID=297244 RepID=A0A1N7I1X8_9FLAO|nr:hypothetical protein [Chryseobacterium shigense]PQA90567.1 hypothetical protein B0A69_19760 [Chryseobacterium shigense]SIS31075.1 hypothetical protein SAMN05421639_1011120 [Chryseobacterium shigense]
MKKVFFPQFFLLGALVIGLVSCSPKSDAVKTSAGDSLSKPSESRVPKNHQPGIKSSDRWDDIFKSLPKEWTMLTKKDSKYIIYIPCDYQNQKIILSNKEKYALEHIIGQDAYYFQIKNIRKDGNTYLFELQEENAEKGQENVMYTLDIKDNHQAVWDVYNDERKMAAITTTDSRFENRYKTVEEPPCLE